MASARAESIEALNASVAFLRVENKSQHSDTIKSDTVGITGTGFFVADASYLFLVTAGHIAKQMGPESEVKISLEENKLFSSKLYKLYGQRGKAKWVYNDKSDVAVMPLNLDCESMHKLVGHVIDRKILSVKYAAPTRGEILKTIGFPSDYQVHGNFSPISSESKVVVPLSDIKMEDVFFMLDDPDMGRFAGAPVCRTSGASAAKGSPPAEMNLECLGLVHGMISTQSGDKFGAVVPAKFINETIDKAIAEEKHL